MHYLIFIPGDDRADPQKLRDVGLSHLVPGAIFHPVHSGPNGLRGANVAWSTTDQKHFDADLQTWTEAVQDGDLPAGRYWLGTWNQSPPRPAEMAWQGMRCEGTTITLGDGNDWVIPAAGLLPATWKLQRDGEWQPEVQKYFKTYFDESAKWFTMLLSFDLEQPKGMVDGSVIPYLIRALQLNYRIVPELVSQLDLFNADTIFAALLASVDGITIRNEKKNAQLAV